MTLTGKRVPLLYPIGIAAFPVPTGFILYMENMGFVG